MDDIIGVEVPEALVVKLIENISSLAGVIISSNPILKSLQEQSDELNRRLKKHKEGDKKEKIVASVEVKQEAKAHQPNLKLVSDVR